MQARHINNTKGRKISVLVVDDESDVRTVLRVLLEQSGYSVTEAADGQEALDLMSDGDFDLMILDLMMPRLTGDEVLEICRADKKLAGIPIIVLTAKSQPRDVERGYEKGASFYVVKPFSNRTILGLVGYLLGDLNEEEREEILFNLLGEGSSTGDRRDEPEVMEK
jgi:two-component system response regulator ResD